MRAKKISGIKKLLCVPWLILFCFAMTVGVAADKTYSFDGGELSASSSAEKGYGDIVSALPDELQNDLAQKGAEAYSFDYFWQSITNALKGAVAPALSSLSVLMGVVILSSAFGAYAKTVGGGGVDKIFSMCCSLCAALAVWDVQKTVFEIVQGLLDTMNSTMLMIVPVMETIYISSGNIGTASVSATGVNLMISAAQSLFSKILSPAAVVCFLLSVCAAVTGNKGISFMSKTLRGLICGILITVMTLMSFVLAVQTTAAQAADSFAQRTIRFAIGSYLPIVGGSVSESFSYIASSLNVIRQMSGVGGIAVLLTVFIPPFALLLVNRLSIGAASSAAGLLGADRERELLCECGSVSTLMLAVCAAGAVMYIVALGIFCKTPLALG